MSHLSIPADLLYKDADYGSGNNGYDFPDSWGKFMRFDPGEDGAVVGSFVPPDDWDGTLAISGTFNAPTQASAKQAEFFIQLRVCNAGEMIELPGPSDTMHTEVLTIPDDSVAAQPVLTWGPIAAVTPDGSAFAAGGLVTFRIAYNSGSANTNNTGSIMLRAVNFDL